jgi:hypothetical protein
MYAGHVGIAIGATARRPDLPLVVLILASLLPDLLVQPIFHTAPAVAALVVLTYAAARLRWDAGAGALLAALVVSHFLVDLLTSHLRVWPNSDLEIGLGLYDLPRADFALEAVVIGAGWLAWRHALDRPNPKRTRPMLILLLVCQAAFAIFVSDTANDRSGSPDAAGSVFRAQLAATRH